MNDFLKDILDKRKKRGQYYKDKAFNSIVNNLFIENKHGKWKAMGIDEYNSEENSKFTMIPGHIYSFMYLADKPTVYNDGQIKFEYYDRLPIILCTSYTKNLIRGINLNLCNEALRTLILNDVINLDPNFIKHDASEQAHQGQLPISKNITKYFMTNESLFLKRIQDKYKLTNIKFIFRTYNPDKIRKIRFIEPWQWQYIPFLNYKQYIKETELKLIQQLTGISKIKL